MPCPPAICVVLLFAMLGGGCATLPSLEGRSETHAITGTATTRLGRAVAPRIATNPGKSGVYAMPVPRDAQDEVLS